VNFSGCAIGLVPETETCEAILQAWYPGEEGGLAITDVLFGDVAPSGKLPVTFYRNVEDLPDFENYDMKGHTYRFFQGKPLYPFGYGLSYTTFDYSDAKIVKEGDKFTVTVKVTNTGKYDGKEAVQVYVSAPKGKLDKPKKELRAFAKTALLHPGESETLVMTVSEQDLASFNSAMSRWETDKGTYTFHVAASVSDVKATLSGKVSKPWYQSVRNVLKPQVPIDERKAPQR
jgi:beta-glucosidase